jgi:hypothetical protein
MAAAFTIGGKPRRDAANTTLPPPVIVAAIIGRYVYFCGDRSHRVSSAGRGRFRRFVRVFRRTVRPWDREGLLNEAQA